MSESNSARRQRVRFTDSEQPLRQPSAQGSRPVSTSQSRYLNETNGPSALLPIAEDDAGTHNGRAEDGDDEFEEPLTPDQLLIYNSFLAIYADSLRGSEERCVRNLDDVIHESKRYGNAGTFVLGRRKLLGKLEIVCRCESIPVIRRSATLLMLASSNAANIETLCNYEALMNLAVQFLVLEDHGVIRSITRMFANLSTHAVAARFFRTKNVERLVELLEIRDPDIRLATATCLANLSQQFSYVQMLVECKAIARLIAVARYGHQLAPYGWGATTFGGWQNSEGEFRVTSVAAQYAAAQVLANLAADENARVDICKNYGLLPLLALAAGGHLTGRLHALKALRLISDVKDLRPMYATVAAVPILIRVSQQYAIFDQEDEEKRKRRQRRAQQAFARESEAMLGNLAKTIVAEQDSEDSEDEPVLIQEKTGLEKRRPSTRQMTKRSSLVLPDLKSSQATAGHSSRSLAQNPENPPQQSDGREAPQRREKEESLKQAMERELNEQKRLVSLQALLCLRQLSHNGDCLKDMNKARFLDLLLLWSAKPFNALSGTIYEILGNMCNSLPELCKGALKRGLVQIIVKHLRDAVDSKHVKRLHRSDYRQYVETVSHMMRTLSALSAAETGTQVLLRAVKSQGQGQERHTPTKAARGLKMQSLDSPNSPDLSDDMSVDSSRLSLNSSIAQSPSRTSGFEELHVYDIALIPFMAFLDISFSSGSEYYQSMPDVLDGLRAHTLLVIAHMSDDSSTHCALIDAHNIVDRSVNYCLVQQAAVQYASCKILSNLAVSRDDVRDRVAQLQGLAPVVGALRSHDADTHIEAARCLVNFSVSEECRRIIADLSAFAALLRVANESSATEDFRYQVVLALRNYSVLPANQLGMVEQGCLPFLMERLVEDWHREAMLMQTISTLMNLASSIHTTIRTCLVEARLFESLCSCLSSLHLASADIMFLSTCADLIGQVVSDASDEPLFIHLSETDLMDKLVTLLRHPHRGVQCSAAAALANASVEEECRDRILRIAGARVLIHEGIDSGHRRLRLHVLRLVQNIASQLENRGELVRCGLLQACATLLYEAVNHPNTGTEEQVLWTLAVIRNISLSPDLHGDIVRDGCISPLVKLLKTTAQRSIILLGVSVLANLAQSDAAHIVLVEKLQLIPFLMDYTFAGDSTPDVIMRMHVHHDTLAERCFFISQVLRFTAHVCRYKSAREIILTGSLLHNILVLFHVHNTSNPMCFPSIDLKSRPHLMSPGNEDNYGRLLGLECSHTQVLADCAFVLSSLMMHHELPLFNILHDRYPLKFTFCELADGLMTPPASRMSPAGSPVISAAPSPASSPRGDVLQVTEDFMHASLITVLCADKVQEVRQGLALLLHLSKDPLSCDLFALQGGWDLVLDLQLAEDPNVSTLSQSCLSLFQDTVTKQFRAVIAEDDELNEDQIPLSFIWALAHSNDPALEERAALILFRWPYAEIVATGALRTALDLAITSESDDVRQKCFSVLDRAETSEDIDMLVKARDSFFDFMCQERLEGTSRELAAKLLCTFVTYDTKMMLPVYDPDGLGLNVRQESKATIALLEYLAETGNFLMHLLDRIAKEDAAMSLDIGLYLVEKIGDMGMSVLLQHPIILDMLRSMLHNGGKKMGQSIIKRGLLNSVLKIFTGEIRTELLPGARKLLKEFCAKQYEDAWHRDLQGRFTQHNTYSAIAKLIQKICKLETDKFDAEIARFQRFLLDNEPEFVETMKLASAVGIMSAASASALLTALDEVGAVNPLAQSMSLAAWTFFADVSAHRVADLHGIFHEKHIVINAITKLRQRQMDVVAAWRLQHDYTEQFARSANKADSNSTELVADEDEVSHADLLALRIRALIILRNVYDVEGCLACIEANLAPLYIPAKLRGGLTITDLLHVRYLTSTFLRTLNHFPIERYADLLATTVEVASGLIDREFDARYEGVTDLQRWVAESNAQMKETDVHYLGKIVTEESDIERISKTKGKNTRFAFNSSDTAISLLSALATFFEGTEDRSFPCATLSRPPFLKAMADLLHYGTGKVHHAFFLLLQSVSAVPDVQKWAVSARLFDIILLNVPNGVDSMLETVTQLCENEVCLFELHREHRVELLLRKYIMPKISNDNAAGLSLVELQCVEKILDLDSRAFVVAETFPPLVVYLHATLQEIANSSTSSSRTRDKVEKIKNERPDGERDGNHPQIATLLLCLKTFTHICATSQGRALTFAAIDGLLLLKDIVALLSFETKAVARESLWLCSLFVRSTAQKQKNEAQNMEEQLPEEEENAGRQKRTNDGKSIDVKVKRWFVLEHYDTTMEQLKRMEKRLSTLTVEERDTTNAIRSVLDTYARAISRRSGAELSRSPALSDTSNSHSE